jgi:transcriptional regulator with XRE-family HTH domain
MPKRGPRSPKKTRDREILLGLLRAIRVEAGLRQEDLARAIGRRQGYVSKYELGERRLDVLELAIICEAVGSSLTEFARRFESQRRKSTDATGTSLPRSRT